MRRREFIAGLGSAAAWPLAARAQGPVMPVIGVLSPGSPETRPQLLSEVRRGLLETGYVEGRNVAIEYRWAGYQNDRLPVLATELVGRQVAVILAFGGSRGALAAKAATTKIPIVFGTADDPVEVGLVASLNRPGGNLTGVVGLAVEVAAKGVEFLHELVPATAVVALLVDPSSPREAEAETGEMQVAARALGFRLVVLNASSPSEIEAAFATLVQERAGALAVASSTHFIIQINQIVALAAQYAVPTVYQFGEAAAAGGLMSYGGNNVDVWHLVGVYTGRILNGDKPADLPVQQLTKIQLIINLKTAKALGLTVPQSILLRADEVIE
jgi:putative tryptophan/tyrosine transport system substrate-binding protein